MNIAQARELLEDSRSINNPLPLVPIRRSNHQTSETTSARMVARIGRRGGNDRTFTMTQGHDSTNDTTLLHADFHLPEVEPEDDMFQYLKRVEETFERFKLSHDIEMSPRSLIPEIVQQMASAGWIGETDTMNKDLWELSKSESAHP